MASTFGGFDFSFGDLPQSVNDCEELFASVELLLTSLENEFIRPLLDSFEACLETADDVCCCIFNLAQDVIFVVNQELTNIENDLTEQARRLLDDLERIFLNVGIDLGDDRRGVFITLPSEPDPISFDDLFPPFPVEETQPILVTLPTNGVAPSPVTTEPIVSVPSVVSPVGEAEPSPFPDIAPPGDGEAQPPVGAPVAPEPGIAPVPGIPPGEFPNGVPPSFFPQVQLSCDLWNPLAWATRECGVDLREDLEIMGGRGYQQVIELSTMEAMEATFFKEIGKWPELESLEQLLPELPPED